MQKIITRIENLEAFRKISERDNLKSVSFDDQEKFWLKQKKMVYGALKRIVDSQKDLYAKIAELKTSRGKISKRPNNQTKLVLF